MLLFAEVQKGVNYRNVEFGKVSQRLKNENQIVNTTNWYFFNLTIK